jgi:hypothetical protein
MSPYIGINSRGDVERQIFHGVGRSVDGDSPTICLHGAVDKYKRLWRESIAEEWLEEKRRARKCDEQTLLSPANVLPIQLR